MTGRRNETSAHRDAIAAVVERHAGAQTTGFWPEVRRGIEDSLGWERGALADLKPEHVIFPDAFVIGDGVVDIYEVEATNRLVPDKYLDLFLLLDNYGVELNVFVVDARTLAEQRVYP